MPIPMPKSPRSLLACVIRAAVAWCHWLVWGYKPGDSIYTRQRYPTWREMRRF